MQSKEKNNIIFIHLFPGEEINNKIIDVCKNHNVKSAVVISGIGQLKKAKLGYFKNRGNYAPETFNEPLELLSISGNICRQEGKYLLHLHSSLGDEKKNVIGGHLIEGIINITAEIVLLKSNIVISRKHDEITGLMSLNLE